MPQTKLHIAVVCAERNHIAVGKRSHVAFALQLLERQPFIFVNLARTVYFLFMPICITLPAAPMRPLFLLVTVTSRKAPTPSLPWHLLARAGQSYPNIW